MSPRRQASSGELVVGGEPRVDLLPPEVAIARRGASARRGLIVLLVVCIAAVAGGYFFSSIQAGAAQSRLESAQAQTTQILAEQGKYSAVNQTTTAIAAAEAAKRVATSTEVDWSRFLSSINATLPAEGSLTSFTIDSATPLKSFGQSSLPLAKARIASVAIVASTKSLADAQVWLAALPALKGVADVTVTSLQAGGNSVSITLVVGVTSDVLSFPLDAKVNQ